MANKKLVGRVGVDSGQVLILDPCNAKFTDEMWEHICGATLKHSAGQVTNLKGFDTFGVASSTGFGDGVYPVYATFNKEGRVKKLEIVFI